jgi:hypothetical protein
MLNGPQSYPVWATQEQLAGGNLNGSAVDTGKDGTGGAA